MAEPEDLIASDVVLSRAAAQSVRGEGTSAMRVGIYVGALLVIRGLLLWIIVPLTFVVWVLLMPARAARRVFLRRRSPSLRQYITWADAVLIAALERSVLRPIGIINDWPAWPCRGRRGPETSLADLM